MGDERLYTDIDYLNNEISKAQLSLETLQTLRSKWITSYCYICNEPGKGYDWIPLTWGYVDGTNKIICDGCIKWWGIRFGTPPKVRREI